VFIFAAGTKTTGSGDTIPEIRPDKTQAPGAGGLSNAINGFAYYALLAAAAGFLLGFDGSAAAARAARAENGPPRTIPAPAAAAPCMKALRSSDVVGGVDSSCFTVILLDRAVAAR